ncbi:glucose 1-dehydrogenase [Nocardioides ginsengisoli]
MEAAPDGYAWQVRALTVEPGAADSLRVDTVPDPEPGPHELLVEGLALGVCGTDREIASGAYGTAPPGRDRLVLGHESLGRVLQAPDGSDFAEGDLVAGIVRRPDPEPCGACARGFWDMCRNGRYTERGIKEHDGYGSERWTVPTEYAVAVEQGLGLAGVLLEPTSVVAKAWEQVDRTGGRSWFEPKRALVTGAGPIGLLAALIGVQRGLDVRVLDVVSGGPKSDLVATLGATYVSDGMAAATDRWEPDVVIEATGVGRLIVDAIAATGPYGIVCLTGVSSGGRRIPVDMGSINRELVLENDVVVGSVNANRDHYAAAARALAAADADWLRRVITRVAPMADPAQAFARRDGDIKTVIALADEVTGW